MRRRLVLFAVLALACPRRDRTEPDPLAGVPERPPAVRARLPGAAGTQPFVSGTTVVVGAAGAYHGFDAQSGARRWTASASAALFPPVASGERLYLPWIEATKGVVAEVDPATGTARRRVLVAPGESSGVAVRFNTPPAIGRGLLFWPSSRLLHAYDLASGAPRWTYEATGPTPFRRFQLGSEPPLLGRRTVYWAHQQGVAAVDLATGRARWTWAAYRGFALRALLGERAVYAFTDGAAVALDRRTGAVAWQFAPPGLLFEHLAGESLAGLFRGRLFFVGEPAPFRYRLYHVDAASGRGLAEAHVPGRGLTGSAAADDARLYARLGADLLAIDLATARPLWRARVGAEGGAASPALGAGRVWVVGGETLWGFDLSLSRRAGGPSRSRGAR